MTFDDDAGYDRNDPKHPTFRERAFDTVDGMRKAARENPDPQPSPDDLSTPREQEHE